MVGILKDAIQRHHLLSAVSLHVSCEMDLWEVTSACLT